MFHYANLKKTMGEQRSIQLIYDVGRNELFKDPVIYCKAVRCTLLALGYDEEFVNVRFRELFEEFYKDAYEGMKNEY